jgi:hypothetical protein
MSIAKKPLQPNDFPVNAEVRKSKSKTAPLSQTPTIRLSRPTLPSALTRTKLGAKKISGRPNLKTAAGSVGAIDLSISFPRAA